MDSELFFLISMKVNACGEAVNYVINYSEWQYILATARANGWQPSGTILEYEFQHQRIASKHEGFDFDALALLDQFVTDKCGRWKGGYLKPAYQIVTDEDARGIREALEKTTTPLDMLLFFSYGAFRIAR